MLSAADMEVLEFERAWWKHQGRKEAVIRERFGYSLTRHTQRVLHLIDQPEALAYDPVNVARLRSLRDAKKTQRRRTWAAS